MVMAFVSLVPVLLVLALILSALVWFAHRLPRQRIGPGLGGWTHPARPIPQDEDPSAFMLYHAPWIKIIAVIALGVLALLALDLWQMRGTDTYLQVVNQSAAIVFGLGAVLVAISRDTCLLVSEQTLRHLRPFRRTQTYDLSDLIHLKPVEGDYAAGYWLMFRDGRNLQIGNALIGIADLTDHLTRFHPNATQAQDEIKRALAGKG